jgi:polysaccharide biosynthesis protein PslH
MGGQKGIALFNRYFSKQVPLTCVTTRNSEHYEGEGYEVRPLLSTSKWRYANVFLFFTLRKFIRQKGITHLLIEHPYYGWLGVLLKWFCKIKLAVHSHNIEALRFKSTGKWWWGVLWNYEKFTHRRAHINFFISDEDRQYAIQKFGLQPERCTTITYGFELSAPPAAEERKQAKAILTQKHGIEKGDTLLLFNGTLDYKPNQDALDIILNTLNPLLEAYPGFKYTIIICGKNLPPSYQNLSNYSAKKIIYAGFVDDITLYFKGADIFINPVMDGGGIKTKLVEALGFNMSVVTTENGAIGVPATITGGKMNIIKGTDWAAFAAAVATADVQANIPVAFFEHFYWGRIAERAGDMINKIQS